MDHRLDQSQSKNALNINYQRRFRAATITQLSDKLVERKSVANCVDRLSTFKITFQKKCHTFAVSSFLNVTIYFSLGLGLVVGRKKQFEARNV